MGCPQAQGHGGKSSRVIIEQFDSAFITQYQASFEEVVRLGRIASERAIQGKRSPEEDLQINHFLKVLRALSIPGLSDDDIESLEYDLISQNEGIMVPTVDSLYPQVNEFNIAHINTPGVRRRSAPALSFLAVASKTIETATRLRSAPAISFQSVVSGVHMATLSLDTVERSRTSPSLTIDEYSAGTDVAMTLSSAFGGSTFRTSFSGVVRTLTCIQGFDLVPVSSSGVIDFQYNVTVTVKKISNAGIAQDAGTIIWRKNGVDVNTYSFVLGENLGGAGQSYAYTGLVDSDEISVYIAEG